MAARLIVVMPVNVPIARERLAVAIHALQVGMREAIGDTTATDPSMGPWELLPEVLRESAREQADDICATLRRAGYTLVPISHWNTVAIKFTIAEIETMARAEHQRWADARVAAGWTAGPVNDIDRRVSPFLVPWEELAESARQLDRDWARVTLAVVAQAGLQVGHGWVRDPGLASVQS